METYIDFFFQINLVFLSVVSGTEKCFMTYINIMCDRQTCNLVYYYIF